MPQEDAAGGPLIRATELGELLATVRPPAVLDVRWRPGDSTGHARYLEGHLPGAVFVDLDRDLAVRPGDGSRGRHPLPDTADFEAAMRRAGVRDGGAVVVYDDAG